MSETTHQTTQAPSDKFWLWFGGAFVASTFVLLLAAFVIDDLSCDRWYLLRSVYPIFAGISAGAFLGNMTLKGDIQKLTIAAGGGFAVFVASTMLAKVPEKCEGLRISQFQRFDETYADPNGTKRKHRLTQLVRTTHPMNITDVDRSPIFLGFVISNANVAQPNKIHIEIKVVGAKNKTEVAWTDEGHIHSLSQWSVFGIPKGVGADVFLRHMGVKQVGEKIPVGIVLDCRTLEELADWNGDIKLTITDKLTNKTATVTHHIDLVKANNLAQPKTACKDRPAPTRT